MSTAARPPGGASQQAAYPPARRRIWLAAAGPALILACLVPPVLSLALRYVLVQSLQFTVFAMAAPGLIALGAPWRLLGLSLAPAAPGKAGGPVDHLAASRRQHRSFARSAGFLVAFMAVSVCWRLPPVVSALPRQPWLIAAELVTLLPAGTALWLELVPSPPLAPRLSRPHRAVIAALAMWFTWGMAYVIGLSNTAVFRGYAVLPGRALGQLADQEIAVAIVWAVAGLCFVPVVITTLVGWLTRGDDPDEELQQLVRDDRQRAVVRGWGPRKRLPR